MGSEMCIRDRGGFSSVFKAKLKGNDVAVKVLKNLKETRPLLTEGNLLR